MARRTRELHPDEMVTTRGGREIAVVSEEQFLTELVNLGRVQAFAGGVITSVVFRQPTDLPGEMVTVGAVLEWKDRTDARDQPEPAHLDQIVAEPRWAPDAAGLPDDDMEETGSDEPLEDEVGDGLQVDEDAVDESAIPESLRG